MAGLAAITSGTGQAASSAWLVSSPESMSPICALNPGRPDPTPSARSPPNPKRRQQNLRREKASALRELEAASCLGMPVFLAFDYARIAREETVRLQRCAKSRFVGHKRTADAVANGARLPRKPAALYRHRDVELTIAIGCDQRLAQDHAEHRAREIDLFLFAVDNDATHPRLNPHAGNGVLAPAGGVRTPLGIALARNLILRLCGGRLRLRLDQRRFQIAESFYFTGHVQAAFVLCCVFLGLRPAISTFSGFCASCLCSGPG